MFPFGPPENICKKWIKQAFAESVVCRYFFWVRCSLKFCNIHRKTPLLQFLFNKAAGLQACNFIKKKTQTKVCFPVNIAKKILRKPFFTEYLRRLFLYLCTKEWYLTHSMPLATFYNPWKHQKIPGVLFSRVLKETSDMN